MSPGDPAELRDRIAACGLCADQLPNGVRPVTTFSATAKLVIISQAPGTKVHESGVPWDDASGDRLRDWTRLSAEQMRDPAKVAIVPMGFCYPGKASGGDKPPRKECAPAWHDLIFEVLPQDRLTLLVGTYAQAHYLPEARKVPLTERVRHFRDYLPRFFPLPHPAWRSAIWMGKNPWFEADVLPELRRCVTERL